MRFLKKASILLGIFILSALAILPFAVIFPDQIGPPGHPTDIGFLLVGIVTAFALSMVGLPLRSRHDAQLSLLINVACLAAISIISAKLLPVVLPYMFKIPTPQILAPLLKLDAVYAEDADLFQVYSEIWLLTAGLFFGLAILACRYRKRIKPSNS